MRDLINYLSIGVLSLVGVGVLIGVLIIITRNAENLKNRDYTGVATTFKKVFTASTYFRAAILVCMVVSIQHGSHLFATKNNTEWLQFALAATIDVGVWVLIEALIALRRRGYLVASVSVLCGIIVLSLVSYAANFVYNQHFYDPAQFTSVPSWFLDYVPFIQSCPPLIIAFMSTVAEVFVKPDNDNDLDKDTFKGRIQALYKRKTDRLEAKLEAKKQVRGIRQKYSVSGNLTRQVKWSFLGVLRGYYEPTHAVDTESTEKIKAQGEKITELVTKLEELSAVTAQQLVTRAPELQPKVSDPSVSGNLTREEDPHTGPIAPVAPVRLEPVTVSNAPASNGHSVATSNTSDLPVYRPKKR